MIDTLRQTPVWLGALLWLLIGMAFRVDACGPDFPNWLLAEGDDAVLQVPEAYFRKELQRMRLVTTTKVARVTDDPERDTLEMDLADLRQSLQATGLPVKQIESRLTRYRDERLKARYQAETKAATDANASPVKGSVPQVTPGLPPEFADYFRGAIAWYQTNLLAARTEWLRLLKRPPAQRHYRSTWAAFMLGKSWESEDPGQAITWYRHVRQLAQSGFADSLGLAVESLGWEARLEWKQKHYAAAIELYLQQAAAGDPTAENSLRFVAADALNHGRRALDPLARSPHAQRLITAYVISGGYRQPTIDVDGVVKETGMLLWSKASAKLTVIRPPNTAWHTLRAPAKLWLAAVESAKVRDVESAEQLALAAYQAGDMDAARRWLDRAKPTLAAQWVRAKLCLRDGKMEQATALLAKVARAFPSGASTTNAVPTREFADSLYVDTGSKYASQPHAPIGQAVQGELAVANLARRRYVETLDSFMHSSPAYWMDAAYVAERVLTLEELKSYVDREVPAPPLRNHEPGATVSNKETQSQTTEPPRREYAEAEKLRYLLGRRLARAYRFAEARPYYPADWLPRFDQLSTAWQTAESRKTPQLERGQALLQAAVITRKYGLELIGTEVEPDWRIHAGNFREGVSVNGRASLQGSNYLAASSEELQKAASHDVLPERRWHYRTVAAVMGWEAAKLLRGAGTPGQDPVERAETLFVAATALRECGISHVPFGVELGAYLRGAEAAHTNTLANRVHEALSELSARIPTDGAARSASASITPEGLWECGFTSAALAWESAKLLPNNSGETARILCRGGSWITWDPPAADILYKALVRRCRKTAIGAEADRLRWFPRLDEAGNLVPRETQPAAATETR
jgi:hypothetical protein